MGLPNKDEIKGKVDQAKGAVKETVGHAVGNDELEAEGKADRAGGELKEDIGKVRRNVGDAISDAGDAIRK